LIVEDYCGARITVGSQPEDLDEADGVRIITVDFRPIRREPAREKDRVAGECGISFRHLPGSK